LVFVVLPELLEMRSLRIAERSPTGTEMKHDEFAQKITALEALAVETVEVELRRRLSDHRVVGSERSGMECQS